MSEPNAFAPTPPWYVGATGATAHVRHEVQKAARKILENGDYQASLVLRAKLGTLPPAVETMLWHYAYGKPAENLNVNVQDQTDLSSLSVEDLAGRALQLARALQEAREAASTINVKVQEPVRAQSALTDTLFDKATQAA